MQCISSRSYQRCTPQQRSSMAKNDWLARPTWSLDVIRARLDRGPSMAPPQPRYSRSTRWIGFLESGLVAGAEVHSVRLMIIILGSFSRSSQHFDISAPIPSKAPCFKTAVSNDKHKLVCSNGDWPERAPHDWKDVLDMLPVHLQAISLSAALLLWYQILCNHLCVCDQIRSKPASLPRWFPSAWAQAAIFNRPKSCPDPLATPQPSSKQYSTVFLVIKINNNEKNLLTQNCSWKFAQRYCSDEKTEEYYCFDIELNVYRSLKKIFH